MAVGLVLVLLLVRDVVIDAETGVYAAFVPVLVWGIVLLVRGRA